MFIRVSTLSICLASGSRRPSLRPGDPNAPGASPDRRPSIMPDGTLSEPLVLLKKVAKVQSEPDKFTKELEDIKVQEGAVKVMFKCTTLRPPKRVVWFKNKIEVFPGPKFAMIRCAHVCSRPCDYCGNSRTSLRAAAVLHESTAPMCTARAASFH